MDVSAEIPGINYKPFLCKKLATYGYDQLATAFDKDASFLVKMEDGTEFALSHWKSPKRTRTYPYARVYDTLNSGSKRVTVIPLIKDEGIDGDNDFLQWDTVSLMSLFEVYTIIAYYSSGERNPRYDNKMTSFQFDLSYVKEELIRLTYFRSNAIHWNLEQIDKIRIVGPKALQAYQELSQSLGITFHSTKSARNKIAAIIKGKENFMNISRDSARKAQKRESETTQPKEKTKGEKARITIKNYLGGVYYFTCDEFRLTDKYAYLVEAKHSADNILPGLLDIKDGLVKMMLFTNLKNVKVFDRTFIPRPILKLTSNREISKTSLSDSQRQVLRTVLLEANANRFDVFLNEHPIESLEL